jgi:tryptophanase
MRGYRINQAQLNKLVDLATTQEALSILDSLQLLDNPYSVVQRQPDKRSWPIAVTAKDVREGTFP